MSRAGLMGVMGVTDQIPVIPAPATVERSSPEGSVRLDAAATVHAAPGTEGTARWLRGVLGAAFGLPLDPAGRAEDAIVRLALDVSLAAEAYRLDIGPDAAVHLTGGGPAGVFWGAQTLRQLLGPEAFRSAPVTAGPAGLAEPAGPAGLAYQRIEDAPRFGWRGMMLDVARHFMPKNDVLRYLDLLAAHKLNVFHFHLTDDQGWRIEIKGHPRLTEVGSWRPRSKWGHRASESWNDTPHGGFYTQDDIREIVAHAHARHITVVPEIDIPGHSQAAIAAYPELGNTDVVDTSALGVWDTWGINPNILAPSDRVLRFYEEVFEEVLALFPSQFVHIGGDEAPKDQWKQSPAAQARIEELGLADEDELQSWFVRHFDTWLTERGRRLIGWDEILEGGLAPGAAVSSWRGYQGGIAAAKAGHDVVMCPEQQVYLDHRQHDGPDEPMPIGYVRTLEDVYRFEPVPPELSADEARHVLGTQANVWTEVMENRARVDYQVFPRLAAFAEVAWSFLPAPAERDFAAFASRMTAHYARLDALGVDYRPPTGPRPEQRRPGVIGRPIEGAPPNV